MFNNFFKSKWGKWHDLEVMQIADKLTIIQFRRHENGKIKLRTEVKTNLWGVISKPLDRLKGTDTLGKEVKGEQ